MTGRFSAIFLERFISRRYGTMTAVHNYGREQPERVRPLNHPDLTPGGKQTNADMIASQADYTRH